MLLRRSTMKVFASWSPTSRYVRCRSGNKNMNSLWNQSFMQLNLHGSVVYMGGYMLFEKDEMYIYNLSTHPMYILFEASQALIHICRDMLKFRTLAWSAGCFSKIKVNADHKSCFGFWSRSIDIESIDSPPRKECTFLSHVHWWGCDEMGKESLVKNLISDFSFELHTKLGGTFLWTKKPTYCMVCLQVVLDFQNPSIGLCGFFVVKS